MNDSARDITKGLLDTFFCEHEHPLAEITHLDRLDAALLAAIEPARIAVSGSDVASWYSGATKQYRSLLLAQLEQNAEFITRQASNVVMATASGAVRYPKPMRTQREALLAHYNFKFGCAYQFASALTFAAIELIGLAKVFDYLRDSSEDLLRPFVHLTQSQMAIVMNAFNQPQAVAFSPELLSLDSSGRLNWNAHSVEKFFSAYIEALSVVQVDQFVFSVERENASRQFGCRPLDPTVLSGLFESVAKAHS